MAQYDVYPNPDASGADSAFPLVVVVQSELLDALATRLVIPLARPSANASAPSNVCPAVRVGDDSYLAYAIFMAPVPSKRLRRRIANVRSQSARLVSAIDAVLSGV